MSTAPPVKDFLSSFLLLVLTGMPLKFYHTDWAKVLFDLLGGPEVAGALHRFGAIITLLYMHLWHEHLRLFWTILLAIFLTSAVLVGLLIPDARAM